MGVNIRSQLPELVYIHTSLARSNANFGLMQDSCSQERTTLLRVQKKACCLGTTLKSILSDSQLNYILWRLNDVLLPEAVHELGP